MKINCFTWLFASLSLHSIATEFSEAAASKASKILIVVS